MLKEIVIEKGYAVCMEEALTYIYTMTPTKEEINHNYLWRFWTRLTNQKLLTVFDRTWYGRVLVERIEHFATDKEWKRAYDEINHFEKQLTDGRNIVVKFLLYITKDEQMERFKAREETAYKKWKIGGKTLEFLRTAKISPIAINKGIQKIRESFRVSDLEKQEILKYKRG